MRGRKKTFFVDHILPFITVVFIFTMMIWCGILSIPEYSDIQKTLAGLL
jgi:spore maturation protein SpmA